MTLQIEHEGQRKTLAEWCAVARDRHGVELAPTQLRARLRRDWPMGLALSIPIASSPSELEHDGQRKTLSGWCAYAHERYGVELTPSQLRARLCHRWPLDLALSRPLAKPRPAATLARRRVGATRRAERERAARIAATPLAPFLVDPSILPKAPPGRTTHP